MESKLLCQPTLYLFWILNLISLLTKKVWIVVEESIKCGRLPELLAASRWLYCCLRCVFGITFVCRCSNLSFRCRLLFSSLYAAIVSILNGFQAGDHGRIACISAPSVYVKIKNEFPNAKGGLQNFDLSAGVNFARSWSYYDFIRQWWWRQAKKWLEWRSRKLEVPSSNPPGTRAFFLFLLVFLFFQW